jgi:putative glutamine amidotransferase
MSHANGTRPPRVALTTTIDREAGSQRRPAVFIYTRYIQALEQVGLAPVLITPGHSAGAIEALLDACCGLVLSGGEDVDPARYGEPPSPALGAVERARDESEFRAVDAALARAMPIFGICRGMQLLNVYFGGTLYQDIPTEFRGDLQHQQLEPWEKRSHCATVVQETMLHDIVGSDRLFINSFHHQAVKDVGRGLRISACADDGIIEGIEHVDHDWIVGVQWHPERNEASTPDSDPDRRLFTAFRAAVEAYSANALAG